LDGAPGIIGINSVARKNGRQRQSSMTRLLKKHDFLPNQYFLVFRPEADR
jgi:hypothetical protein